jgi:alpha-L-fucosidase
MKQPIMTRAMQWGLAGLLLSGFCSGTPSLAKQGGTPMTGNELEAQDVGESNLDGDTEQSAAHDARMEWWREARFGCFVHWGVSTQLENMWHGKKGGGYAEHIQRVHKISMADYKAEAVDVFNPTEFDATEWIDLVKRAGMRYFVITAKHHDGFAMYDSKVSDYNIVQQTPWKRDPMKELKAVCDQENIKFGFYYSHAFDWGDEFAPGNDWEWENPGGDKGLLGGRNWWENQPDKLKSVQEKYVNRKSIPQIEELARMYDPALLWFDTPHKLPVSENERILDATRKAAPNAVINGRLVRGKGDYLNTGDRAIEFVKRAVDWEAIPTTNESYGWSPIDHSHKTPGFLIRVLGKAVSRGGNILLNIGPMQTGAIDPKDIAILEGIAEWMAINSEAIHGCNASPLPAQPWGAITSKDHVLYLHVFDWPKHPLLVGGLLTDPFKATLLTAGGDVPLTVKRFSATDVEIALPAKSARIANSVVRLEFDQEPKGGTIPLLDGYGLNRILAFDAVLHRGDQTGMENTGFGYRDGKRDNYAVYRWTQTEQWMGWEVRVNEPTRFEVSLRYGVGKGGEYELRIGDWKVGQTAAICKGAVPWIAKPHVDELGDLLLPAGVHQIELRLTKTNSDKDEALRPLELRLKPSGPTAE